MLGLYVYTCLPMSTWAHICSAGRRVIHKELGFASVVAEDGTVCVGHLLRGWHCIRWLFVEIGFFRLYQGEPVCVTCAALHRLVTLGTFLELIVRRAQSFVTEQARG